MKKKILCAILSAVILLCGCDSLPMPGKEEILGELHIEIYNAVHTPNGVYYKSVDCSVDGEDGIKVTQEQIEQIISCVEKIKDPSCLKEIEKNDKRNYAELSVDNAYLGSIKVEYYTGRPGGEKKYREEKKQLFDEYPEGYEDLIKLINGIDGKDQIILGKPLAMSDDMFKKITGFTDEMVTDGTIGDVLKSYPIDAYHLMNYPGGYKYMKINTNTNITDVFKFWPMFRALPTGIRKEESTEEEFTAFVENLAKALGADPSTVTAYDRLGGNGKAIPGQSLVVYQTSNIPEGYEYSDTLPYHLVHHNYYDGGELDQADRHTVFYSKDGKFAVVMNGCLERAYLSSDIKPEELNEYYQKIADLVG